MTARDRRGVAVTPREHEVLLLVAGHLTNSQIATELCVSVRTVESHLSSLMRKLQVADRRSLARRAHTIGQSGRAIRERWPAPVTSFVGRVAEGEALRNAAVAHRLVTVTGPGGVGKTRLAMHVAQDIGTTRRDGGWFVDLVAVTDPEMVFAAVASTIGIVEQHGSSLADAVTVALAASDALIVLDNCEHLIPAVSGCAERLLTSCPAVSIIATSRARLMVPFEWVFAVPGLSVADDGGDAVSLFNQRAIAAGAADAPDDRRVAAVCRALDGIALAIELAAARSPSLGLDGLIDGLDQSLLVLTSGGQAGDRHRSLRDTIAWSYHLLDIDERDLLCGLSVFASWFDVGAAALVAAPRSTRVDVAAGLARLAEHSLLVALPGEPTRYRALETIRQFGAEQLHLTGERDAAHARHHRWCLDQLSSLAGEGHDDAWCVRFDRVAAETRAAIVWCADHGADGTVELTERLAGQLFLRGQPAEAQRRYEQAARHAPPGQDRARLLRLAAGAASTRLVGNDAVALLEQASNEARVVGDDAAATVDLALMVAYIEQAPGIMAARPDAEARDRYLADARGLASNEGVAQAAIAVAAALCALAAGEHDAPERLAHATELADNADAPLLASIALDGLCSHHLAHWRLGAALDTLRVRGARLASVPLDATSGFQFNDYLLMASEVHLAAGNLALAAEHADALARLACYRDQDYPALARAIQVDAVAGNLDAAVTRGERFLAAWERAGRPLARTLVTSVYAMATVHALRRDEARRQQWLDIVVALAYDPARLATAESGFTPTFDALVALDRDQPKVALERLSADIDDPTVWNHWHAAMWRPWYAALWAEAAVLGQRPDAEDRIQRALAATAQNPIATTIVHRAAHIALGDLDALPDDARTLQRLGCRYQQHRTITILNQVRPVRRPSLPIQRPRTRSSMTIDD